MELRTTMKTIKCKKIEDSTPVPVGFVARGYVDDFGSSEEFLWDWMIEEPGTIWKRVFVYDPLWFEIKQAKSVDEFLKESENAEQDDEE